MLKVIVFSLLFLASVSVHAKTDLGTQAYTLELQGGLYQPTDVNWEKYYGGKNMIETGVSVAFRVFSFFDVGVNASLAQDKGTGRLPASQISSGSVVYQILPVDVFAVLRLGFVRNQWVVPFIGGGYTRLFYRQSVNGAGYARGSVNALHVKAGFQVLLDQLDPLAAREMLSNYGVRNSYLVFEGKLLRAEVGDPAIDIGGMSYRLGILMEY